MVTHLNDFKARRIEGLRVQWDAALAQAELLQNAGNYQHARPHLERAKELRAAMDKLGGKRNLGDTYTYEPWKPAPQPLLTFTFAQDLGNFMGRDFDKKD